jgi:hypothetical protein
LGFLVAEQDRAVEVEVNNYDNFISCTRLVEAMFDVAEAYVHFLSLRRRVPQAILMNFKVTKSFLSDQVWPYDQVVKLVSSGSFVEDKLVKLIFSMDSLDFLSRFVCFDHTHALFDLF